VKLSGEPITDSGRTEGFTQWSALNPTASVGAVSYGPRMRGFVPHFPGSGVSGLDSNLKGAVLCCTFTADDIALYEANFRESVLGNSSNGVALTQLGDTNLWFAIVDHIPFNDDVSWEFQPGIEKTTGSSTVFGEIFVLGANLFFEPP
jgi:hypothetical protein